MIEETDLDRIKSDFERWNFLFSQIHSVKVYSVLCEGLESSLAKNYDDLIKFQSYFSTAVLEYGKCFVSAGQGRTKLEIKDVFKNNELLIPLHEDIMQIRHEYVAHAVENELEKAKTKIKIIDGEIVVSPGSSMKLSIKINKLPILKLLHSHLGNYANTLHHKRMKRWENKLGVKVRMRTNNDDFKIT